jgi:hypothetical protein
MARRDPSIVHPHPVTDNTAIGFDEAARPEVCSRTPACPRTP